MSQTNRRYSCVCVTMLIRILLNRSVCLNFAPSFTNKQALKIRHSIVETPDSNRQSFWRRHRFGGALLVNLGMIALVTCFVIWLALMWLDIWTDHGHYETVPQVKGLSYDLAVGQLRSEGFDAEIADSVYDTKTRPGTVIEQNPKEGTKVKAGRVVYLTITAFEAKMVSVPMLTDVSERQARSVLEGIGIKNIVTVKVPSEYRDLVLGVKRDNVPLAPGARVPVTSVITLEVGEGGGENADSVAESFENPVLSDYFD